jgi:hypothetical protein
MKRPGARDDGRLLDGISAALAALSGPTASGERLRWLRYGPHDVAVKEGALGDGVGAKVWQSAHAMCRELLSAPSMVEGKDVLEIGAGCGACGLLAARLGPTSVVLSDYVDRLLLNLRDAVHLNFPAEQPGVVAEHGGAEVGRGEGGGPGGSDAAAWEAVRCTALAEAGCFPSPLPRTRCSTTFLSLSTACCRCRPTCPSAL